MKIKLFIILLVLLISSIFIISNNIDNKTELNLKNNTLTSIEKHEEINIEKEVIKDESNNETITNNKQDNNKTSGTSSNSSSNDNSNSKESNNNSDTNVVEKTKEEKVDLNSTRVDSDSTIKENNSIQEEKDSTQPVEQKNPWDDLGITKDDYYNKPMWSWARVDYSIKKYETIEKTQQACIDAGNNMMVEILSFSCTSINSYSGDYLGEMLRVKY